ncbi:MAG TPA: hypothetical protein VGM25_01955 [Caulobacteraceae bacterium]|jgi:hypothetical protein
MSPRWLRALLIGAAWLPATAVLAQHEPPRVQMKPPAPEGTPAVAPVAAEATTPAELKRQTFAFVQGLAAATPNLDLIAHWADPLCVTVQGLPASQGAQVKARVEEVGKALKLKVLGSRCNPNIEIMFADQPQPFLDRVASTREDLLGYWHQRDRDTLKAMTRPVQAWYVTATTSSASGGVGTSFADVSSVQATSDSSSKEVNGEAIDDPGAHAPRGCADSRLSSCLKSVFNHVLVVVDNRAVQGASSGLLADYVAMLAMAQPQSLDGCSGLTSVIDLYSRGCSGRAPPDGLTRTDVAYLTSLYRANLEARKASQQADIANRMADMLLKADAEDRLAIKGGTTKASAPR